MIQESVVLRNFLSRALAAPLFISAILVGGIMGNNSVKLFQIWTSGSRGNAV